jgi:hypothetical protein
MSRAIARAVSASASAGTERRIRVPQRAQLLEMNFVSSSINQFTIPAMARLISSIRAFHASTMAAGFGFRFFLS